MHEFVGKTELEGLGRSWGKRFKKHLRKRLKMYKPGARGKMLKKLLKNKKLKALHKKRLEMYKPGARGKMLKRLLKRKKLRQQALRYHPGTPQTAFNRRSYSRAYRRYSPQELVKNKALRPLVTYRPGTAPIAVLGNKKIYKAVKNAVIKSSPKIIPMKKAPGRVAFLGWMKKYQPLMYAKVMASINTNRRFFGAQVAGYDIEKEISMGAIGGDLSGLWADFTANIGKALPAVAMAYQQRIIFKENLKRARTGLAPLKGDEIAPKVKLEMDLGEETTNRMVQQGRKGLEAYIFPGLVVGGLIFAMKLGSKK